MDLAKSIAPTVKYKILSVRPSEKFQEEMITARLGSKILDIGD